MHFNLLCYCTAPTHRHAQPATALRLIALPLPT
jgi:hypothetical protein